MKTGLIRTKTTLVDYSPGQAARDAARRLAPAAALIAAAGRDPAAYAAEFAADVGAEVLAEALRSRGSPKRPGDPPEVVARAVADRARLLAIDLLAAAFRPAADPIPYTGDEPNDTVRGAFWDALQIHHLGGVDSNARRVGGSE